MVVYPAMSKEVIKWLNSKEGMQWSSLNFARVWAAELYNFKSAHCDRCDPEPSDMEGYDHEHDRRFDEVCPDLSTDGPYAALAGDWIHFAAFLEDE
jgi:hypothetical protein